jgi:hypothetical protein
VFAGRLLIYAHFAYYKKMSIKQKVLNTISAHPKLSAIGIGLAITMAIGVATGTLDHQAFAISPGGSGCTTGGAGGA